MAGSERHPSIQLLVSLIQFGFVVVVMMLGPKQRMYCQESIWLWKVCNIPLWAPISQWWDLLVFSPRRTLKRAEENRPVLLTRNLGCSCDSHRPPAVVCNDKLKDGRSGLKNERGRKEIATLWFLLNMKCSFRKFLLWLKAWGIHCSPWESSNGRVAGRNKPLF